MFDRKLLCLAFLCLFLCFSCNRLDIPSMGNISDFLDQKFNSEEGEPMKNV